MPGRPRILFATVAAGGGHLPPALAMGEAVEDAAPGAYDTQVSDLMLDLGLVRFDTRHKAQWRWMLARPWTASSNRPAFCGASRLSSIVRAPASRASSTNWAAG